jgi:hypothetical protein
MMSRFKNYRQFFREYSNKQGWIVDWYKEIINNNKR